MKFQYKLLALIKPCLVLLLICVIAPGQSMATKPRVSLHLFKYSGVHDSNEQARNQFDNFKSIIHAKISSISEELSLKSYFAELKNLSPFFPLDSQGNHVKWTGSNADLMTRWQNSQALEIFLGRIRVTGDVYSVRSEVFFGDLQTSLGSKFIKIDLPIVDDQYDTTRDSHSVVILYALAMDARQRCRPENEVIELLSAARERLADVPSTLVGIESLRAAVDSSFEAQQTCNGAIQ